MFLEPSGKRESFDTEPSSAFDSIIENINFGTCRVRVCSYNVNCKFSKKEMYDKWLNSGKTADIIAIGFQELYFKLKDIVAPDSIFKDKTAISPHKKWIEFFESLKFIKEGYTLLLSKSFGGLCLIIFLRKSKNPKITHHVSNLLVGSVPVGMLGMANKGALSISFRIGDLTLCFINCHLPAGGENSVKRQYSFQAVIQRLQLFQNNKARSKKINFMEADIDVAFLFGDLNFRIQNLTAATVINKINHENLKSVTSLLQSDELVMLRESDALYKSFYEAQIEFLPTYKFFISSNVYESKRVPSYCDRILWMGNACLNISYKSYPEFKFSDHKPISAEFVIDPRKVVKRHSKNMEHIKEYPRISVEDSVINFGDVYFMKNKLSETTITNLGNSPVEVSFKTLENNKEMPTWFTIIPSAFLLNGKSSKLVQFRIFIDYNHVSNFNKNVERLNCRIIYACVASGIDVPLTFTADYHVNIFGLHLEILKLLDRPIDSYKPKEIEQLEITKNSMTVDSFQQNDLLEGIMNMLMPKIKFSQSFEDVLLRETSNILDLHDLIQKVNGLNINTRLSFDAVRYSLCTYVEALLIYMKSLPQPIIPFVVQARLATSSTNKHHILNVLHNLPRTNLLLLRRIIDYLHGFIRNNGDVELISSFFVSCIPPSNLSLKDPLNNVFSILIKRPSIL